MSQQRGLFQGAFRLALCAALLSPGAREVFAQGAAVSASARSGTPGLSAAGASYGIYTLRRAAGSGQVDISLTPLPGLNFPVAQSRSAGAPAAELPEAGMEARDPETLEAFLADGGRIAAEQLRSAAPAADSLRPSAAPHELLESILSVQKGGDGGRAASSRETSKRAEGAYAQGRRFFDQEGERSGEEVRADAAGFRGGLSSGLKAVRPWAPRAGSPAVEGASASRTRSAARSFWEAAETLPGALLPLLASGILLLTVSNPVLFGAATAASWFAGSLIMKHLLSTYRSVVVGGWQASHDQKYRVGSDGRLHDVRGHKYGSDRYEQYAPGPVGPKARFLIRAAAAWMGLFFLLGSGAAGLSAYALALAAFFILEGVFEKPRKAVAPIDAESAAHAARFSRTDHF